MRLSPESAEAVSIAALRWAESTSDCPLTIRKTVDGAVCVQTPTKLRYTKGEFAELLEMSRNTFRKLEVRLGLEPAGDNCYACETVEWVRQTLANEESKRLTRPPKVGTFQR